MNYLETRARKLEVEAAALRAAQETVTVELSKPVAWLLRDLIGMGVGLQLSIPMREDLLRLNKVLGARADLGARAHVSHWSSAAAQEMNARD